MHKTRDFFDINQNNWRISLQLRSTESFSHFAENEMKMKDKPTATIPYKFIIFFSERGAFAARSSHFHFPFAISLKIIWDVTPRFSVLVLFFILSQTQTLTRDLFLCVWIYLVCVPGVSPINNIKHGCSVVREATQCLGYQLIKLFQRHRQTTTKTTVEKEKEMETEATKTVAAMPSFRATLFL